MVVTDESVAATQLPRLHAGLGETAAESIILPRGESTKSWAMLEQLTDRLLELGVERSDRIVALGGGVIGDLVAAGLCHLVATLRPVLTYKVRRADHQRPGGARQSERRRR